MGPWKTSVHILLFWLFFERERESYVFLPLLALFIIIRYIHDYISKTPINQVRDLERKNLALMSSLDSVSGSKA